MYSSAPLVVVHRLILNRLITTMRRSQGTRILLFR
jgi:hypothetical protein